MNKALNRSLTENWNSDRQVSHLEECPNKRINLDSGISDFDTVNSNSRKIGMVKPSDTKKFKGTFIVQNDRGLHTRPSTEIVKCATNYKSDIFLIYQKNHVNAKSLLGILMLAASKGSKIQIEAEGVDAEEAVASLIKLAKGNFNIKY